MSWTRGLTCAGVGVPRTGDVEEGSAGPRLRRQGHRVDPPLPVLLLVQPPPSSFFVILIILTVLITLTTKFTIIQVVL
eukprot:3121377-Rhodomonas_salina.3